MHFHFYFYLWLNASLTLHCIKYTVRVEESSHHYQMPIFLSQYFNLVLVFGSKLSNNNIKFHLLTLTRNDAKKEEKYNVTFAYKVSFDVC